VFGVLYRAWIYDWLMCISSTTPFIQTTRCRVTITWTKHYKVLWAGEYFHCTGLLLSPQHNLIVILLLPLTSVPAAKFIFQSMNTRCMNMMLSFSPPVSFLYDPCNYQVLQYILFLFKMWPWNNASTPWKIGKRKTDIQRPKFSAISFAEFKTFPGNSSNILVDVHVIFYWI